ncbi:MAG: ATPase domain-containing protein [Eudoraea sp.]|nr:ATPase domain-containing protein [Eudoraea sp.]
MSAQDKVSTGIPPLDNLLGGGFLVSAINLIYGEATSGKTTLTLTTALHHLENYRSSKTVYLDIDNKLNVGRLQQLATKDESVLRRLNLYTPESFKNQSDALEQLPALNRGDIVIIDSITGLYRGETEDTESTFELNKELNRLFGYITEIEKTTGTTMLLTGQVRSILDSSQIEPVAQRILRSWSSTIIKLEKSSGASNRQATMEKPIGIRSPILLTLNSSGIVEATD